MNHYCTVGLDQNIRIFVWWVGIRFSILRFEFILFFLRFSFTLEYESPMSEHHERHDSVNLEKTKMPKTSAVWEHFKLSEDTTKAVCQICDLKLAYHNSTSSLKNHLSSISSTSIVYCWCKKKNQLLLSAMLISNFTHDKNVHLICLENTCEYSDI